MHNTIKYSVIFLCLSGCMVGPVYQEPTIPLPITWRTSVWHDARTQHTGWWKAFQDSQLDLLMATALQENKDLKVACARVEEYAALFGISRADLYPQVDLSGSATRQKTAPALLPQSLQSMNTVRNQFTLQVGTSYEIDFWGRVRLQNQAAWAQLLAEEHAQRTVMLSLLSQVAQSYFTLRRLDAQLEISKKTAASLERQLQLIRHRAAAGFVGEMPVRQAESEWILAQQKIPLFEQMIAQEENGLSLLLGRNPGAVKRGLPLSKIHRPPITGVPLPAELLERRPDVQAAEQRLIAANAGIGVAQAAYFPKIDLLGLLGSNALTLDRLFTKEAQIWQWGGGLTLNLFNAGKTQSYVDVAKAQKQQALWSYLKAVQTALGEVENALVACKKLSEQEKIKGEAVAALEKTVQLADLRYRQGLSDYLEVITAQNKLFDAELSLTETQADNLKARVLLYKALGGGYGPIASPPS